MKQGSQFRCFGSLFYVNVEPLFSNTSAELGELAQRRFSSMLYASSQPSNAHMILLALKFHPSLQFKLILSLRISGFLLEQTCFPFLNKEFTLYHISVIGAILIQLRLDRKGLKAMIL